MYSESETLEIGWWPLFWLISIKSYLQMDADKLKADACYLRVTKTCSNMIGQTRKNLVPRLQIVYVHMYNLFIEVSFSIYLS